MSVIKERNYEIDFRRFPDIQTDSVLYSNPFCHTLSNTFEMPKKLPLTSSDWL